MHITILDTNTDSSAFAQRHQSELEKFQTLLTPLAPEWRYRSFRVCDDQFPEDLSGSDGLILTGSPASVNSDAPWVARLQALIRDAAAQDIPMFGACFGHQAIATALSGAVGYNPQGWVLGVAQTTATAPAEWMQTTTLSPRLHAAHKEQVTTLPSGARILGTARDVAVGHMAIGNRIFSTQYHPEITHDFMCELIEEMTGEVDAQVLETARASMELRAQNTVIADWIVRFFDQARR